MYIMVRELNDSDRLYLDFINYGSDSSLKMLVKSVDEWLFEVIFYSVADKELANDVLKQVWSKFISSKSSYDLKNCSIEYHIYLIAVDIIYENIKAKDG